MAKKSYKAANGSPFSDADAKIIGNEIDKIMERKNGEVQPIDLIQEARKRNSPLHRFFEWDNDKAAEKWRQAQARKMLYSVVETVVVDGSRRKIRSFFGVKNEEKENVYVTLKSATSNKLYTKQLFEDCETYITHFMTVIKILKSRMR